jgi:RHS repeat-associated protein
MISAGDTTGTFETYTYDGVGNRTKTTNAAGNETITSFTVFNKPARTTDARGNHTTYTYDKNYNLITVVDRMGNTTVNTYDKLNRLIQVVDPLDATSALTFDKSGNMIKMTDANEKETQYTYDAANQLISITYADGTTKAVTYNAAGKIIRKTDQNGAVIDYERDDLYRIVQRKYPDTSTYDYTYDKLGRLKTATNDYGTVSFTYDAAGRITQIDQNGTKITYEHDVIDRTRTIHYPGGRTVVETYSLRDKISSIGETDDADNIIDIAVYTYDALSRPLTKTFGNGVASGYTYNQNSRITAIAYKDADDSDLMGFQYGYDKEGNRLYTRDTVRPDRSEQYAYDDNQRLNLFKQGTADTDNQIPTPQFKAEYELDPLGNFLKESRDGIAETRSINAMNQYTKVGDTELQYDAYGNLIDDGKQIYQYDYENQLIKVTRKSDSVVIASFTIDALNRRVKKTAGNVVTEYIYDDSRIIEERVANDVRASYVYGNGLDEIIQMERDGSAVYFLTDAIGSVMALTDAGGNLTETYQYDAYGRVRFFNTSGTQITESARENPYLFTGRRYDVESGIYYYRARCYHPDLGRFLNPDPKGFIDGLNLYEYAMSNPLRYIDPRGTATKSCDTFSFDFNADKIKNLMPKFLSKYMDSGSFGVSYQKCKECCGEGTKHAGEYMTNKELGVTVGWSGDTGYINTPWGISWDIDVWVFQSKGFIGLVAKVSWGISGSLSGGYDSCDEKGFGKGCIAGSLTMEALFGLAEEDEDSSLIKAYVSGGVGGKVEVCIVVKGGFIVVEAGAGVSGAIKGTVGIWRFTYEKTFVEISGSIGPYEVVKI